jgi:hypothetical protein
MNLKDKLHWLLNSRHRRPTAEHVHRPVCGSLARLPDRTLHEQVDGPVRPSRAGCENSYGVRCGGPLPAGDEIPAGRLESL